MRAAGLPESGRWGRLNETSLALRIALASALFGLLAVGLASAGGYWALARQLDSREAATLDGKRDLVEHLLSEAESVDDIPARAYRFAELLSAPDEVHLAVLEQSSGRLLASFSPAAVESVRRVAASQGSELRQWQGADGKRYVSLSATGTIQGGQAIRFVLSLDRQDDLRVLAGYVRTGAIGLPLLLLLIGAGAWSAARAALRPVQRFTRLASSIGSTALSPRMSRTGLPEELRPLADSFNAMLERLDEAMRRLHEFSADLAHEMRTPVATLLGRTQVALARDRSVEGLRDVLAGNVEELERLTRLIADMLFLARAEQSTALETTQVRLGEEARRVTEFLAVLADERGVQVEITGDATVSADPLLVQRAITNLLTNAIRHAERASTVAISVDRAGPVATLAVTNRGRQIRPDQLTRVFERFVRLDPARGRAEGGSGLGLAIVRSIMQAHEGRVEATSEADGVTTFRLVFSAQ